MNTKRFRTMISLLALLAVPFVTRAEEPQRFDVVTRAEEPQWFGFVTRAEESYWSGFVTRAEEPRRFDVEFRIYRVLTNISGETSQQLEGVPGSFHTGEMIFDTVTATMKGGELKWNGEDEPDHPRIISVSNPRIVTLLDQDADVMIHEGRPLQYFEKKPNGDYELKGHRVETGVHIRFRISEEKDDGVLVMRNFLFESSVATGREKLEHVDLDVGKPIIDTRRVEGPLQCRAGEWVGITYRVPSQGAIYIFMKVKPLD